jgi:hypothetical protein
MPRILGSRRIVRQSELNAEPQAKGIFFPLHFDKKPGYSLVEAQGEAAWVTTRW